MSQSEHLFNQKSNNKRIKPVLAKKDNTPDLLMVEGTHSDSGKAGQNPLMNTPLEENSQFGLRKDTSNITIL